MPGSLSQPRTCYPPAACSDLVNEFISSVAMAGSASPHSDTQPVSFCRVGVKSESKLSAVAPAKQVYSIMTATLLHGWRVGACMWDLFFFYMKLFPKCQLFKNYAKQILKRIHEPKSHLSQRRRKLVSTWQQKYSIHFFPSLSFWINLFVCPLFLLFLWASTLLLKNTLSIGLVQATELFS